MGRRKPGSSRYHNPNYISKKEKKKKKFAPLKNVFTCGECSSYTNQGAVDPNDETFYCFLCWEEFGGVPESLKQIVCILCKQPKTKLLFSKNQIKRKKPICVECIDRRKIDSRCKAAVLQTNVAKTFNDIRLFHRVGNDWRIFNPPKHYTPSLNNKTFSFKVDVLIGVNNVGIGDLLYTRARLETVIAVLKLEDDFKKFSSSLKKDCAKHFYHGMHGTKVEGWNVAKFALTDKMRIYSLSSVMKSLSVTFIFDPSPHYDVREKYTLRKMALFLSTLFHFPAKYLVSLEWPVQIYLENYLDCSEATSNEIVSFTGEVLVRCTFSTPELGELFKPWDTWEADICLMGDYVKETVIEKEGVTIYTMEDYETTPGNIELQNNAEEPEDCEVHPGTGTLGTELPSKKESESISEASAKEEVSPTEEIDGFVEIAI